MSDIFADATVRINPDVRGFAKQLDVLLAKEMLKVKTPVVRVRPLLTRNALGDLRKQVNDLVAKVQPRPVRIRTVIDAPSRRQISNLSVAGVDVPGRVAGGGGLAAVEDARIRALQAQGGVLLGVTNAEKKRSAAMQEGKTKTTQLTAVTKLLTAEEKTQQALSDRLALLRKRLNAAEAEGSGARGVLRSVKQLQERATLAGVTALDKEIAALRTDSNELVRNQREALRTASSHAQLSRGIQSSSLSFLGIRGATLAASRQFLIGAASVALFAKVLGGAGGLETQLNVFQATTGATADEMERVGEAARALGADLTLPAVSSADAAGAMVELAKAGLSVRDAIAGARGILQLATAAAIDNAQAVEIAANALNTFGLEGKDAIRVADVFANAANLAQGSIVDIGIAFQQAAAAGRQVGLTFEDTSLFLTVLARNGLRGSDAGTSLRTALIRLINPTKKAREEIARLGIQLRDAQGNLRPDIFIQVAEATRNLSPAARDATIALLGGQDAFRAFTILGRQTIGSLIQLRRRLREQGSAAELAEARTKGLRGAADALGSTLETVGTSIGGSLSPGIANFTRSLAAGVAAMASSEQVAETLSDTLTAVGQGFNLIGQTIQAVAPPLLAVASAAQEATSAIGVTEILAAIAAYKLLPIVLGRVTKAYRETALAIQFFEASQSVSIRSVAGIRTALAAGVRSLNLYAIAAAAAAGGLLFLLTRESETERATRHLTEASEGLIGALEAMDEASRAASLSSNSVNAALGGVFDAQAAVDQARSALAASTAERGSFERRKLALALAIAIDNEAIAEQRLADARRQAKVDAEVLAQREQNRKDAIDKQIRSVREAITAERRRNLVALGGRTASAAGGTQNQRLLNEEKSRERIIQVLQRQAAAHRKQATEFSIDLAKRETALANFINELDRDPTDVEIDIIFDPNNTLPEAARKIAELLGRTGDEGAREFLATFLRGTATLGPAFTERIRLLLESQKTQFRISGFEHGRGYGQGVVAGVQSESANIVGAIQATIADATRDAERAATRIEVLAGSGASLATQLAAAQDELAAANRRFENARRLLARGETPSRREEFEEAASARRAAFEQVRSIQDQIRGDAEEAANQAEEDQRERDQAFLDLLGVDRQRQQNRIAIAQATAGLADDIATTRKLRQLIQDQIKAIIARVKDQELKKEALAELRQTRFELFQEIKALQRERAQEIQEQIRRGIELDIEFAQTVDNAALERRARNRLIQNLQKELNALNQQKKLTIEQKNRIKEIRNEIAAQRKALQEITEDRRRIFAELSFAFLTTQQGFAANLLGNLLPFSAIGGTLGGNANPATVGGSKAPPSVVPPGGRGLFPEGRPRGQNPEDRLQENQRIRDAQAQGGFTAAQAATLIHLTKQIVQLLGGIDTKGKHPEARRAQRAGSAVMDVM